MVKYVTFLNSKPQNYEDVNSPQLTYAFIIPTKISKCYILWNLAK